MHSSTVSAMETSRFLGSTVSQNLKGSPNRDTIIRKGLAEHPLPLPAHEVQPVLEAVETFVLCSNTVSSLLIHHCMVWISHQTGQGQTIEDSEDSRKKNHCCQIHSVQIKSRETNRHQLCKPSHHGHNLFLPLPLIHAPDQSMQYIYCFVLVYI